MAAQVIQFRDYQNPKDLARMYAEQTLEQQALEVMTVAQMGEPDTAPSEYNPDKEPA